MKINLYSTICKIKESAKFSVKRKLDTQTYCFFSTQDLTDEYLAFIPSFEDYVETKKYVLSYTDKKYSLESIDIAFCGCTRCNLCHVRRCVTPFDGDTEADVLFVGLCPMIAEENEEVPINASERSFLQEMLTDANFKYSWIYTNLVCCSPVMYAREEPKTEEILACSDRLWATIVSVKPKLIVALSKIATRMFTALEALYDKQSLHGTNFIYMRSPNYLMKKMARGSSYEYTEAISILQNIKLGERPSTVIPHSPTTPFALFDTYFKALKKPRKGNIDPQWVV